MLWIHFRRLRYDFGRILTATIANGPLVLGLESLRIRVDAVAALAKEFEQHCEVLGLRKKALDQCLKKLDEPEIELLKQRYWMGTNMRDVANKSGISEHKIYRRLSNIRQSLQECIDLVLANLAGQN